MKNKIFITTTVGFILGIICATIIALTNTVNHAINYPILASIITTRIAMGFAIGISNWKINWALHGILVGTIVGLPFAVLTLTATMDIQTACMYLFINLLKNMLIGLVINFTLYLIDKKTKILIQQ